ncbi:lipopolysaccharide biosynthesis protein [Treponema primitia ZAS-2]|uniref:Lipopolysaccharide biosynthesis protein n=1 Tax=Treponema primitia (strain ATCC BAA-887 / DSM 12427 / ZAS-2) TaxID=545694 RepID=F5YN42_TREPZ|nr:O-antigen translocase [Treponema primitia]AEF85735.1 lipopolysaccharide biosynthesis protein [Treponema primitia ZAS-2]
MVNRISRKIKKIFKLDIIKVFSFTSISTLVKMASGFIGVKVVAVIIGPTGVALVGQLNNFSSIIMAIATGGIITGVIKYIAQYKDDTDAVRAYIGTAVKITLSLSFICGLLLILTSRFLAFKILLDTKYSFIFIIFGLALSFYVGNTLLLAIINGYKQFNLYVKISIISSIIGLCLSLCLVIPFGVNGALINTVTSQSFVFIILLFLIKKANVPYLSKNYIWNRFDKSKAAHFFRFSLMTLVSAFCTPVSQLILRRYIIDNFSMQAAGWWEGINRLSHAYLMIITSSFSVYYLPKLSELSSAVSIKREIKTACKVIIPCLVVGLSSVYFNRFLIIDILFSSEFYEMSNLLFWRLIGDFFKVASWLIAYLMHAKAMAKLLISTEIIFSSLEIILSILLSNLIAMQGIMLGYAINYFIYFSLMVYLLINNGFKLEADL